MHTSDQIRKMNVIL